MLTVEKPGTPEELVIHFGIKGQRWGVRKERDTSTSDRKFTLSNVKQKRNTKREAKAQAFEDEAKRTQKSIDLIKANPSKHAFIQRGRDNQVKELEKHRDQKLKDAQAVREGHLTSKQKKVLVGAGAAAAILAAYGTYKFVDSGGANRMLTRKIPFKKNDLLSRKMSSDAIMREVVKPINPDYGELGTKMNCRRATMAYEMRRRGNDVKATKSVAGTGQNIAGLLNATDPDAKFKTGKVSIISNIVKEKVHQEQTGVEGPLSKLMITGHGLGKVPVPLPKDNAFDKADEIFHAIGLHDEGSRGELGLSWKGGGAHSMAWEIIGGAPHIFDAQSGTAYTQESFAKIALNVDKASTTRLDNLPLNSDYLRRWITNVK